MSIDLLNQINDELLQINTCFKQVFTNTQYNNPKLSKKHTAALISKVFELFQRGSTEDRNQIKQLILSLFRSYLNNLIKGYIAPSLISYHTDQHLVESLLEKWKNYKQFVFYYVTVFNNAQNYFQNAFKYLNHSSLQQNKIQDQKSIFPMAAVAVFLFRQGIWFQYGNIITKYIRQGFQDERNYKPTNRQEVKTLMEIVWSCGLEETAAIQSIKHSTHIEHQFRKTNNHDLIRQYESKDKNGEIFFRNHLLSGLIEDAVTYYSRFFEQKLSLLNPTEDFSTVKKLLEEEDERSNYYFFTSKQREAYSEAIVEVLVRRNFQLRINRQNGFPKLVQNFLDDPSSHQSSLHEIAIFWSVSSRVRKVSIQIYENFIKSHITSFQEEKSNKKLSTKRKQFIIEIIQLKKALNQLIEEVFERDLALCIARDKGFRKILDSLQASRNVAEFVDFKIKQCIKNKFSEENIRESFKQIFLVLENLVATDSFLLYHQENLSKRLIDALNQPRIDIEQAFLALVGEKLGSVSVASHRKMIKDIENSQEFTETYSKLLAFSPFRWTCRVITPLFWPDNANKQRFQIQLPESVRIHSQTLATLYHEKFDYRFLSWKLDRGYSLMEGHFSSGKFRFQGQNIFLMLLLHISESKDHKILFGNLQRKVTPIKEGDKEYLMKCIGVLIENGLVLRDNQNINDQFTEGQQVKINMKYRPKAVGKGNQVVVIKVSPEMQKAMHRTSIEQSKIIKERQKLIQAILVKLLKHSHSVGTNNISFQELYRGVQQNSHLKNFNFSEAVIKQRLQELISRQYCVRDENDRKIYHYIA